MAQRRQILFPSREKSHATGATTDMMNNAARVIAFGRVLNKLGLDKLELAISGAAPLPPETDDAGDLSPLITPVDAEFRVGTMGLGWDSEAQTVVVELLAVTENEFDASVVLDDATIDAGATSITVGAASGAATAIGTDTRGMPVSNGDRRRLTPIRVVIATAMVLAIGYVAAGCIFERRGDAEDLDRHIRAMPGVANTDMTYTNTFTSGERFDLNVTLQQDITEEQIQDVGRYFANRTDETGLAERSAYLSLRLPTVPPPTKNLYARGYQSASFSRGPYNTAHSPSGDDIAAAAAAWLRVARSCLAASRPDFHIHTPTITATSTSSRI